MRARKLLTEKWLGICRALFVSATKPIRAPNFLTKQEPSSKINGASTRTLLLLLTEFQNFAVVCVRVICLIFVHLFSSKRPGIDPPLINGARLGLPHNEKHSIFLPILYKIEENKFCWQFESFVFLHSLFFFSICFFLAQNGQDLEDNFSPSQQKRCYSSNGNKVNCDSRAFQL